MARPAGLAEGRLIPIARRAYGIASYPSLLLLPILGLASVLRFDALRQRGLIYWDEGKFSLEGLRMLGLLRGIPALDAGRPIGKAIGTAKPGHALLIAMGYAVFGVHDYAPLLLNATAGTLQVAVLFLLGRRLFNVRVGLVAAVLLAVSGYEIVYARSALSESDATLMFLVGTLLWCWRRFPVGERAAPNLASRWLVLAAGFLLGAAFTINYRLIIYIAVLVAFDLVLLWRHAGRRAPVASAVCWGAGLALIPLLWQVAGAIAEARGFTLFRGEITYRPTSFLAEALYQLHGGKQAAIRFNPLLYLQWYMTRQGWVASLLLPVGIVAAIRARTPRAVFAIALVIAPFLIYLFAPFIVPRNLTGALPFAALISALGLVRLVEWLAPRRSFAWMVAAALLLALLGSLPVWPLLGVRSGLARAAGYVQRSHRSTILVENQIMVFYLRDGDRACHAVRLPPLLPAPGMIDWGADYAVLDKFDSPIARFLRSRARLAAQFPALGPGVLPEDLIRSENGYPPTTSMPQVGVYDLRALNRRADRSWPHSGCTLDRLA